MFVENLKATSLILFLLLILFLVTCPDTVGSTCNNPYRKTVYVNRNADLEVALSRPNTKYVIRHDHDISGKSIEIGENSILDFHGGMLRDANGEGVINGNGTIIQNDRGEKIFDGVIFLGSYGNFIVNVAWFGLEYDKIVDNSKAIIQAINLSRLTLCHTVEIKGGDIYVNAHTDLPIALYDGRIALYSNCHFVMSEDTYLRVIPSSERFYSVLYAGLCDNVTIEGGNIVGDLELHPGAYGEWGYGICFLGCSNSTIKNVNISDCWGDGINLDGWQDARKGGNNELRVQNKNILIEDVTLVRNRRQGISISNGQGVMVKNCNIINTGILNGTPPMYGIDIEPMSWDNLVTDITIDNVKLSNNKGGGIMCIETFNEQKGVDMRGLIVRNCTLSSGELGNGTLQVGGDSIIVNNNKGDYFYAHDVKHLIVRNNSFTSAAIFDHYIKNEDIIFENNEIYSPTKSSYAFHWNSRCDNYAFKNNKIKMIKSSLTPVYNSVVDREFVVENCSIEYVGNVMADDQVNWPSNISFSRCSFIGYKRIKGAHVR